MSLHSEPECDSCRGDLGWPSHYNERQGVEYQCPMCGVMDSLNYVKVSEMETEYLTRLYTYASRVDSSIEMEADEGRFIDLRAAVADELVNRGESPTNVSISYVVYTNKSRAYDIEEEFPGFFTIGSPPKDASYDFGTPAEEMEWESWVSEEEAARLDDWDDVTIEPVE